MLFVPAGNLLFTEFDGMLVRKAVKRNAVSDHFHHWPRSYYNNAGGRIPQKGTSRPQSEKDPCDLDLCEVAEEQPVDVCCPPTPSEQSMND